MLTVAIVCGAGVSSTFLARRLSDIADSTQQSLWFVPLPLESLDPASLDLVALASHVASGTVTADLTNRGIAHVVLPPTGHGGFGAEAALTAITEFCGASIDFAQDLALTTSEGKH